MKLTKVLNIITTTSIAGIIPVCLCQCSNQAKRSDPIIEPELQQYVQMDLMKDEEGSQICTLLIKDTYKTTKKISDVSVKINNQSLTKNTHYIVNGITNSNEVTVKIFKQTLDKYSGDIVITPTISDVEQILTDIEIIAPTQLEPNSKITTADVIVYPFYNGVKSLIPLEWSTGYEIYHYQSSEPIEDFGEKGYTFTTEGTYTFKIKCVENPDVSKNFTIKVEDTSRVVVSFFAVNGVIKGSSSVRVTPGTKWGQAPHPATTADYGYNPHTIWRLGSATGQELTNDYEINSNITIWATFNEKPVTVGETKVADFKTTLFPTYDTYVPTENKDGDSLKYIPYSINYQHTFKIELGTVQNIRYFWLYMDKTTDKLYTFQNKKMITVQNVVDGVATDIPFKITPYISPGSGTYLTIGDGSTQYTQGTIEVTVKFFESNNFIPAFQSGL